MSASPRRCLLTFINLRLRDAASDLPAMMQYLTVTSRFRSVTTSLTEPSRSVTSAEPSDLRVYQTAPKRLRIARQFKGDSRKRAGVLEHTWGCGDACRGRVEDDARLPRASKWKICPCGLGRARADLTVKAEESVRSRQVSARDDNDGVDGQARREGDASALRARTHLGTSHPAASCCSRRAEPSSSTFTARSNVAR